MTDNKIEKCIECGTDIEMEPVHNSDGTVTHEPEFRCAECYGPLCEDCVNTGLPQFQYGDDIEDVCTACSNEWAHETTNVGHTSLLTLMKDGIQCSQPKKN